MNSRQSCFISKLVLLGIFVAGNAAHAAQLYRYEDEKGVKVIDHSVPPEYISRGYDIINPDGSLVKRIPRQLTEDELKYRNTDESRARLKQEEEEKLRAWDESLMMRYSTIEDIEAARDRALRDLNIRISILKSNLYTIKSQIEGEQQKAANIERAGRDVPEALREKINILRLEIEDTEQSVVIRNEEVGGIHASYQRDIDRFETLLDRVEVRSRSYHATPSRRPKY